MNENSLKRLNEYIESATNTNRQISPQVSNRQNGRLTFYLRRSEKRKVTLNASHNDNLKTDLDNGNQITQFFLVIENKWNCYLNF